MIPDLSAVGGMLLTRLQHERNLTLDEGMLDLFDGILSCAQIELLYSCFKDSTIAGRVGVWYRDIVAGDAIAFKALSVPCRVWFLKEIVGRVTVLPWECMRPIGEDLFAKDEWRAVWECCPSVEDDSDWFNLLTVEGEGLAVAYEMKVAENWSERWIDACLEYGGVAFLEKVVDGSCYFKHVEVEKYDREVVSVLCKMPGGKHMGERWGARFGDIEMLVCVDAIGERINWVSEQYGQGRQARNKRPASSAGSNTLLRTRCSEHAAQNTLLRTRCSRHALKARCSLLTIVNICFARAGHAEEGLRRHCGASGRHGL